MTQDIKRISTGTRMRFRLPPVRDHREAQKAKHGTHAHAPLWAFHSGLGRDRSEGQGDVGVVLAALHLPSAAALAVTLRGRMVGRAEGPGPLEDVGQICPELGLLRGAPGGLQQESVEVRGDAEAEHRLDEDAHRLQVHPGHEGIGEGRVADPAHEGLVLLRLRLERAALLHHLLVPGRRVGKTTNL